MTRFTRGLLLGLLLCLVPAAAIGQSFGQNKVQYTHHDWRSISSDHFEVYFYDGLDSLAMRVMDLAEKTNVVYAQRFGHQLGRRIPAASPRCCATGWCCRSPARTRTCVTWSRTS